MRKFNYIYIALFSCLALIGTSNINNVQAQSSPDPVEPESGMCDPPTECITCIGCNISIPPDIERLQGDNSNTFEAHRIWMLDIFFRENLGYAMGLMTNQMTAVGLQAVKMIGSFFDAKHQLETQRLFQTLMAEAHKDYQPSEGMCDIGTNVRGLIASERKTNLTQQALANRVMQRQLNNGDVLSSRTDLNSDLLSRIDVFKHRFCQTTDNVNGLRNLCEGATAPRVTINRDVDYTRTVDSPLTIDIDFSVDSPIDNPLDANGNPVDPTSDEVSAFALMTNLFAHETMPNIGDHILATPTGLPREAAYKYLNLRSVAAKRSVAQNSISAIIAEKSTGQKHENGTDIEYAPFLKSAVEELGVVPVEGISVEEQLNFMLGVNPSYFAQMEVLTKKLYQNPVFYTELYDKPTNVLRKRAAIRAIGLMQDRDYYKSLLRSEAVLSVLLESMLDPEHDRVYAGLKNLNPDESEANQ